MYMAIYIYINFSVLFSKNILFVFYSTRGTKRGKKKKLKSLQEVTVGDANDRWHKRVKRLFVVLQVEVGVGKVVRERKNDE